jgi:aldoxime dehydratase
MESAIPQHLQTARSRHRRVGDDYRPPYPSFVARHKPAIGQVVMAFFGLQYRGDPPASALVDIAARFSDGNGPSHWDRAHYIDQAGFSNVVTVAYWDNVARFDAWFAPARQAWTGQSSDGIAASSRFCGRALRVMRRCFPHPTEPRVLPFSRMA